MIADRWKLNFTRKFDKRYDEINFLIERIEQKSREKDRLLMKLKRTIKCKEMFGFCPSEVSAVRLTVGEGIRKDKYASKITLKDGTVHELPVNFIDYMEGK